MSFRNLFVAFFVSARLLQFSGLAYISNLYFIFSNDLGFCQTVSKIANSLKSLSSPSSIPSLSLLWSSDSYWRAFKFLFIYLVITVSSVCAGAVDYCIQNDGSWPQGCYVSGCIIIWIIRIFQGRNFIAIPFSSLFMSGLNH